MLTRYQQAALAHLDSPGLARFAGERDHLDRGRLAVALIALGCWFDPLTGLGGIGTRIFYWSTPAEFREAA